MGCGINPEPKAYTSTSRWWRLGVTRQVPLALAPAPGGGDPLPERSPL